jgi:endonuclease IV
MRSGDAIRPIPAAPLLPPGTTQNRRLNWLILDIPPHLPGEAPQPSNSPADHSTTSMLPRAYRIGATLKSTDISLFSGIAALYDSGEIDHIQIQVIPEPEGDFRKRLECFAAAGVPAVIHAPHHGQGVNPCAPAAYEDRPLTEIRSHIEHGLHQTFEAADRLNSTLIVIHAGWYRKGERSAATQGFCEFLDRYADPRMILENLPSVFLGRPMLGTTAADLQEVSCNRLSRYCLDFAHLYCAANFLGITYAEALIGFKDLDVRLFHLSNSEPGAIADRHLPLDHPNGGLPFADVMQWIRTHPDIATSLEYRNSAEFYASQLAAFDRLYTAHQ